MSMTDDTHRGRAAPEAALADLDHAPLARLHRLQHDGTPLAKPKLGGPIIGWAADEIEALRAGAAARMPSDQTAREAVIRLVEQMCPDRPESNFGQPVGTECEALADAILAALSTRAPSAAERLAVVEGENARLRQENARLRVPDLFWIDEEPETGYIDPWEAAECALGWDSRGGVACVREGRQIGVRYYAVLPPAEDSDSVDDWTGIFDTAAAADEGIAAERARRAALDPAS